ncbi:hypothetical protein GGI25_006515, partial [Coemansia spiralis]
VEDLGAKDCFYRSGPRSKQDGNGASAPTSKPEGDKRTLSADSGANNIISDYFNHLIVNALMALVRKIESQHHAVRPAITQVTVMSFATLPLRTFAEPKESST